VSIPELIRFCPRCGRPGVAIVDGKAIRCDGCGFVLFFNVASAAGAIIADPQGRILLLRRDRDPQKGKLAMPGGFIDAGETAEHALCREVREEVNLEVTHLRYLCSFPNRYEYKGVVYPTEDLYFVCMVKSLKSLAAQDEVESFCFLCPKEIDMGEIAFPTARQALEMYFREP
jgi:mutator protein MutT